MDNNDDKTGLFEMKIDTNSKMIRERVYLSPTVDQAIRRISEENHISRSAVIRILLSSNWADYLSSIFYIDTDQGQNIQKLLSELICLFSLPKQVQLRVSTTFLYKAGKIFSSPKSLYSQTKS